MKLTTTETSNFFILFGVIPVLLFLQSCNVQDESEKLYALYEESREYREADDDDSPVLSADSLKDLEQEYNFNSNILEQLDEIDREQLDFKDKISYDLFKRDVKHDVKQYEFRDYFFPIDHEGGFHTRLVGMQNRTRFDSLNHYEDYITRLRSFPGYFQQHIERMRRGMESGYVLPKAVMVEEYKTTITSQITDNPVESGFYEPFTEFPSSIPEAERERLREEGKAAVEEAVIPAYESFLEFMEEAYMPAARESIATTDLPNGGEYYNHLVEYYITEKISPEEVHEIGLNEVERIRAEMEQIIEEVEFKGSFEEFLDFLRTDARFYVEEPEQLLKEGAYIAKRMDGKLPELFNMLPRKPYGIEPVPAHLAPRYTGGRYSPGRGDDQAGNYWLNTYNLKSRPLYTLEALTFHEAVPGHHLQIAMTGELEDLHEIRRRRGVTAYSEGWALYAERLGLEAGFYRDPYSNFGRLTYEMWRACRLVVDTGMHALGWSRQEAVDFMTRNTALSNHEIDTEINRYIAVPGQALSYKMGELKIRGLRERAEEKLGTAFDIGEFHDTILLNGPVTLPLLEKQVEAYIREKAADDGQ